MPGENIASNAASKATDIASDAVSGVQGKLAEITGQSWVIILIIVAMVVLVLIVVYIVSMVKKTSLQNVVLQTNLIAMDNRTVVPYLVPSGNMSLVTNGQEFSYNFWIFLGGAYASGNQHKLVLQRGNINKYSGSMIQISPNTNPLIMLDSKTNKMYFAVLTNNVTTSMSPSTIFAQDANGNFKSGWLISYIDYVPLQRWVNISLVVKNTAMYVYMDADLYSVASLSDLVNQSQTNINPMIMGSTGDLTIGDSVQYTSGYISLTRFFNYAMGQPDLQALYNNGPALTSWLSYLGLGNYGVRSPVYEISA
jgi:hypothetical protein